MFSHTALHTSGALDTAWVCCLGRLSSCRLVPFNVVGRRALC